MIRDSRLSSVLHGVLHMIGAGEPVTSEQLAQAMATNPVVVRRVMAGLREVHQRLKGRLGPAARLGETRKASTLRGPGHGVVIDGPFAETKEQLLGFFVIDCDGLEEALDFTRELAEANPGGAYEVRPIGYFVDWSAGA